MAVLTEEQTMLRDAARSWAQEQSPVSAFRRMRDARPPLRFDTDAWDQMVRMGWTGVLIPEAYGGSDFGSLSMGLILEETGRTLTASPLLASCVAAASALALGGTNEQKSAWLPKLAAGEAIGTLAVDEGAHHAPEQTALRADPSGEGYRLTGSKTFVLEGMAAHLLVVAARTAGAPGGTFGLTLFLIPADAPGVTRRPLELADSRGAAEIRFEGAPVGRDAVLGEPDQGWPLLEKVLDRARAALAAEMVGAASAAFETTVDYLKTRVQFGALIGSFQALQHRAARMFTELELARSAVEAALAAMDSDSPETAELASLAKAAAGSAFHLVSNEMVQMHGGIGMTDAHDAGLYLKRARAAEAAFGGRSYHRERFARIHGY
jgi:alkylation response protein AidB-like acyl-CoA dehydrogenase